MPVVSAERIEVVPSVLLDGVPCEPPPQLGRVVPVAVVVEVRLGVVVLGREAEGEDGRHCAALGDCAAAGVVVGVLGHAMSYSIHAKIIADNLIILLFTTAWVRSIFKILYA